MITLSNVQQRLGADNVIQLSYIYSYRSRRYWRLLSDIEIELSNGQPVVIKAGYYTDLSSSPKWLWSMFPPFGDFLLAALIHDWLYSNNIGSREDADLEMFYLSQAVNGNELDNVIRYNAVRCFGKSWWDRAAGRLLLEKARTDLATIKTLQ